MRSLRLPVLVLTFAAAFVCLSVASAFAEEAKQKCEDWGIVGTERLEACATACQDGDVQSCYWQAYLLDYGLGVALDFVTAAELYQQACDEGHLRACTGLAWLYNNGQGVKRDEPRAATLFEETCQQHEPFACRHTGTWPSDFTAEDATALTMEWCEAGDLESCQLTSRMIRSGYGSALGDITLAYGLLVESCDHGLSWACKDLAYDYEHGINLTQNTELVRKFRRKACELKEDKSCGLLLNSREQVADEELAMAATRCDADDEWACYDLARAMVSSGSGVIEHDEEQAAVLLEKSCPAVPLSCHELGNLHFNGTGVDKDVSKAVDYWLKACDSGVIDSCYFAANRIVNGRGVNADPDFAVTLLDRACSSRHGESCNRLSILYERGEDIGANADLAAYYYEQACRNSSKHCGRK